MTPVGTKRCDWVLTIKNGAAGAASVGLSNAATGESCHWGNALAADAWLRLDSARQVSEVSTDGGETWVRRNENMTGLIPQLQGGVANAVTYTGPTTGTYTYSYTAKG